MSCSVYSAELGYFPEVICCLFLYLLNGESNNPFFWLLISIVSKLELPHLFVQVLIRTVFHSFAPFPQSFPFTMLFSVMFDLKYRALMGTEGLEDCSGTGLLLKQDSWSALVPVVRRCQ